MQGTRVRHSDDHLGLGDRESSEDVARAVTAELLRTLRALGFGVTVHYEEGDVRCTARHAGRFVGSCVPAAEGDAHAAYRCVVQLCVALSAEMNVMHPAW